MALFHRDDNGIWLQHQQLEELFKITRVDPTIRACRDRIAEALFSGGLVYKNAGKKKTSEEFQTELDNFWMSFAQNLFDDLFMFGFSTFFVEKIRSRIGGTDSTHKIPVVLPFGTYRTLLKRKNAHYSWHCYPLERGVSSSVTLTEDKKITYLHSSREFLPSIAGYISTPITTLVSSFTKLHELYHYALVAESIRSQPQLVTTTLKNDRSFEETAMLEDFSLNDAELYQHDEMVRRTEKDMMALRMQQQLTEELNSGGRNRGTIDPVTGRKMISRGFGLEKNTVHLGENKTTAGNVPMPVVRSDLMEMERNHQDTICSVLGVPRSIVMSEHNHSSGADNNNSGNETFRRTVDSYRAQLTRLLNIAYETVYKVTDGKLTLPGTPLVNSETLNDLYEQGGISKKTQIKYLLRAAGLDDDDMDAARMKEVEKYTMMQMKNDAELPRLQQEQQHEHNKLQLKQQEKQVKQQQQQQKQQQSSSAAAKRPAASSSSKSSSSSNDSSKKQKISLDISVKK